MDELRKRTSEADTILGHANMHVKKWIYSGDNACVELGEMEQTS